MSQAIEVIGLVVVKNEEFFIERVIENISGFCDKIFICDNQSTDRTGEILKKLAGQYAHIELQRIQDMSESHDLVSGYAGSRSWIFAVDGDEIYDPIGLQKFRGELEQGLYDHTFSFYGHCCHLQRWDEVSLKGYGYLTPAAKSCTKLYNFSVITEWKGCRNERLHGGKVKFKEGWHYDLKYPYMETIAWEESSFRCLHVCFSRRSSLDPEGEQGGFARPNIVDVKERSQQSQSHWKLEQYRRGDLSEISIKNFGSLAISK